MQRMSRRIGQKIWSPYGSPADERFAAGTAAIEASGDGASRLPSEFVSVCCVAVPYMALVCLKLRPCSLRDGAIGQIAFFKAGNQWRTRNSQFVFSRVRLTYESRDFRNKNWAENVPPFLLSAHYADCLCRQPPDRAPMGKKVGGDSSTTDGSQYSVQVL